MEAEEKTQEQQMSDEMRNADSVLREKRSHVPTAQEVYYHDLAYKPLPALNIKTRDTVMAMENGAPWILAKNDLGKSVTRHFIQKNIEIKDDGFNVDGLGDYEFIMENI